MMHLRVKDYKQAYWTPLIALPKERPNTCKRRILHCHTNDAHVTLLAGMHAVYGRETILTTALLWSHLVESSLTHALVTTDGVLTGKVLL